MGAISSLSESSASVLRATVGAFFCAGFTPEYLKKSALDIKWTDIIKYLRLSFSTRSIFDWSRISRFLKEDMGNKQIEDLNIPFGCVAADIDNGQEVVFKKGKVVTAISASSCIPGVFPPVRIMDRHLVDGELVNPVPIDIAFELGADFVIGVNTCRSLHSKNLASVPQGNTFIKKMDDWFGEMIEKVPVPVTELYNKLPHPDFDRFDHRGRRFYDVITDSLAIVSSRIVDFKRQFAGPHFMIKPNVGAYKNFDFDSVKETIDFGYEAADEAGVELLNFVNGR